MKFNYCILFPVLLLSFLFHTDTEAQNIRGDTIYADVNIVVTIVFPSSPSKAQLSIIDGQDSLYEVSDMGKKSISIMALKKGAKDQALEVAEGRRKHLLILSYKEGSLARTIDWSTVKKLSVRVEEKKREVSKSLSEANILYDQARNDISNQVLWEKVEAQYLKLINVEDSRDAGVVKSRLEESRTQIKNSKGKKYDEAITTSKNYLSEKKYPDARKGFQEALKHKPGDIQALNYINLTDSLWAKVYVDKGDEANKAGKKIDAKSYYKDASYIKPDYPFLLDKVNQAKKDADPEIYKIEKTKLDLAMKANDIEEARRAYDSILSIYPNDKYTKSQLPKLINEEKKIEEEKKEEADYQHILATAKSLADKASNVEGIDVAIKEYKRASDMIPARIFPKKRINELTKIKNGFKAK